MSSLPLQTRDTASTDAVDALQRASAAFGFTPNLIRVMANAPAVASAYLDLGEHFSRSSLSATEQQVVLLSVSFANGCDYCMAAHTGGARAAGLDDVAIEALRSDQPLKDPRLEGLRRFAGTVVRERGWVDDADLQAFQDAGFARAQALDVILGVTMKTLSNYTNHLAGTPLDEQLSELRWTDPREVNSGAAGEIAAD